MSAPTFAGTGAPRARPVRRQAVAPVRLTRRGRRLLLTVTMLLLCALLLLVFSLGRVSSQAATPEGSAARVAAVQTVVVAPGETLWDIAVRVAPHADPRDTVARLQEANGLTGSDLSAGQQLVLPSD